MVTYLKDYYHESKITVDFDIAFGKNMSLCSIYHEGFPRLHYLNILRERMKYIHCRGISTVRVTENRNETFTDKKKFKFVS